MFGELPDERDVEVETVRDTGEVVEEDGDGRGVGDLFTVEEK